MPASPTSERAIAPVGLAIRAVFSGAVPVGSSWRFCCARVDGAKKKTNTMKAITAPAGSFRNRFITTHSIHEKTST
jgi:hypothetical protein